METRILRTTPEQMLVKGKWIHRNLKSPIDLIDQLDKSKTGSSWNRRRNFAVMRRLGSYTSEKSIQVIFLKQK